MGRRKLPLGRALSDDERALIAANLGLPRRIVLGYVRSGCTVPMDDLVSAAEDGLIRAAQGFDPARNLRFSTYAGRWIVREIREAIRKSYPITIPKRLFDRGERRHFESIGGADGQDRLSAPNWDDGGIDDEQMAALRTALESLPEKQRRMVEQTLDGRTLRDISRSSGVPSQILAITQRAAVARLRTLLGVA